MDAPNSPFYLTFGEDGLGYYSDNIIGCYDVIRASMPMMRKAFDGVAFPTTDKAFVTCDYGSSDGGTSMPLIRNVIAWCKEKYGKDQEIQIIYEDQPTNDFKSLFLRLNGMIPGPASYLTEATNIFVTACGTNFYSQCVPSGSVHLGFSSTAFHWLSRIPCQLSDAIHHCQSNDTEERRLYALQAAKDWETILLLRAKELAPGGRLLIVSICLTKEGYFLGNSPDVKCKMFDTKRTLLRRLVDKGRVTEDEFRSIAFNNYYRNEEEIAAPFNDPDSPVYKSGLRLLDLKMQRTKCPYREKWMTEGKKGDPDAARKHAIWYLPNVRTWSNYTYLSGLSGERSESEKKAIIDEFFQLYEDEVAAAPEDHAMDYYHIHSLIEKIVT